jgi:hypothetical protein
MLSFLMLNRLFDVLVSSDGCSWYWAFGCVVNILIIIFVDGVDKVIAFGIASCSKLYLFPLVLNLFSDDFFF